MNKIIYCDFDGTISKYDTINKFLQLFASDEWLDIEDLWIKGTIGSKECLLRQISLIQTIDEHKFNDFLNSIEIDESFLEFYTFLKSNKTDIVILSDGLDLFIKSALEKYKIFDIDYYANSLVFENRRLYLTFPHSNKNCLNASGMCKCSKITRQDFYYIGDGLSDVCIAKRAGTLFAKHNLRKYCDENKIDYVPFDSFKDVQNYFVYKGGFNAKADGIGIG